LPLSPLLKLKKNERPAKQKTAFLPSTLLQEFRPMPVVLDVRFCWAETFAP